MAAPAEVIEEMRAMMKEFAQRVARVERRIGNEGEPLSVQGMVMDLNQRLTVNNQERAQFERNVGDRLTLHEVTMRTSMEAHMTDQQESNASLMQQFTINAQEHEEFRNRIDTHVQVSDSALISETTRLEGELALANGNIEDLLDRMEANETFLTEHAVVADHAAQEAQSDIKKMLEKQN